jgi:hypothetical protein
MHVSPAAVLMTGPSDDELITAPQGGALPAQALDPLTTPITPENVDPRGPNGGTGASTPVPNAPADRVGTTEGPG